MSSSKRACPYACQVLTLTSERARSALWVAAAPGVGVVLVWLILRQGSASAGEKLFSIIIVLTLAGISLRKPRLALYVVAIVAVNSKSFGAFGIKGTTADAALIAFTPGFLVAIQGGRRPPWAWMVGAAALVGGAAFAATQAGRPGVASWGCIRFALIFALILATRAILRDEHEVRRFAAFIVALGVEAAAFGWLQDRGRFTFVGHPFDPTRIDSTFSYYSNYGNFIGIAFVLAIGLTLAPGRLAWCWRALCWVAIPFFAYSLLSALSRGAWLEVVSGATVLVLLRIRKPVSLVVSVFTIAILAVATVTVFGAAVDRIQLRFETSAGSDLLRYQLQDAGKKVLADHPGGIGYGNFADQVSSGAVIGPTVALAHAHSLYITTALDAGWVGLIGLVLVLAVVLAGALWLGLSTAGKAPQAVFAAAIVGFLVQGRIDYFFFETGSLIIFGILIGGAFAISPRLEAEPATIVVAPARRKVLAR